jgi:alkylation response protein AidB-like acyl-CoA dehydrogenase
MAFRPDAAGRKEVTMISFEPSEEQQLVRDTVAGFAAEQIRPAAREADESGEIPDRLVQQAWELGLVQSPIPEAFGGHGDSRSAITSALVCEELGWADLSIALHILAPRLLTYPVIELGSDAQRQQVLPAFAGDRFTAGTAALMEPRINFDVNELATTAARRNGSVVLNGTKCYVPLAAEAEHLLVYAAGETGLEAYLVPRGTPGLTVGEREKNMGLKGLATYELELEDCAVPAAAQVAGDFKPLLNRSRVALAALAVGVARAAFEYAREYAKDRRAFGTAIGQKQAIAFMLAEMAIEIDATRLLTWEAAWKLDRNEDATREACLAKNYAAAMALKVTDNAVQVLGGHGYIRDHLVELFLRNARGFAVFEGLAIA